MPLRNGRPDHYAVVRESGDPDGDPARFTSPNDGHPATGDRLYSADEAEWLRAIDRFKAAGRPFPTECERLAVLRSLGYRKPEAPTP